MEPETPGQMPQPTEVGRDATRSARGRRGALARRGMRQTLTYVLITGLGPVVAFFAMRPYLPNSATALAASYALPVAWAVFVAVRRRRVGLSNTLTIGAYGLASGATLLIGSSPLPLELDRAVETGAVGAACLVSVAIKRPLLVYALRSLSVGRRGQRQRAARRAPHGKGLYRGLAIATLLLGAVALAEAGSQATLALLLPVGLFLVVSAPTRLASIFGGTAVLLWYGRRSASRPGGWLSTKH